MAVVEIEIKRKTSYADGPPSVIFWKRMWKLSSWHA